MADAAPIPVGPLVAPPSSEERTLATLAHLLQLVGWWIAPLIIFLLKRDSRFVAFHALQALLLQIAYIAIWMVWMVGWFAVMFSLVLMQASSHGNPPVAMLMTFPLFWLGAVGMWMVLLVVAIVYGIKAGNGEWAEYPVLGRLARRMLKIGPDGAVL